MALRNAPGLLMRHVEAVCARDTPRLDSDGSQASGESNEGNNDAEEPVSEANEVVITNWGMHDEHIGQMRCPVLDGYGVKA